METQKQKGNYRLMSLIPMLTQYKIVIFLKFKIF
jgi:hypothetical protein